MKIFLINPPVFNDIGKSKSESPPLSLLYLAGYLEKNGYVDIKVIDADIEEITWEGLKELFVKEKPDIIGIGGTSCLLPAMIKTAKIAKQCLPDSLVVVGGFGSNSEPKKVLIISNGSIDFVIMGEGEITLLELIKWKEGKIENIENIDGLAFLKQDNWQKKYEIYNLILTKPRERIKDLDSLPWPAFHLLTTDFSKYPGQPIAKTHYEIEKPIMTIMASRGCPHRCIFCSLRSKAFYARSPKNIIDEVEHDKNKFGLKSVAFYDDEFVGMSPLQNKWVGEICDEIIKRKLNLNFLAQGRCSQFIELDTLKKMKEAGFKWIWWGVESGSQKVLDIIKKDIKVENVYRAFDLAKQAGLKSMMMIMIGFPGETKSDLKMSANMIKKIKPDELGLHITTPFPGSPLRKYLQDNHLLENNLDVLEDYYKLSPSSGHICFHTNEMTSVEIERYYKHFIFRFKYNNWHLFKIGLESLATQKGFKKTLKQIKIVGENLLCHSKL